MSEILRMAAEMARDLHEVRAMDDETLKRLSAGERTGVYEPVCRLEIEATPVKIAAPKGT